MHKVLFTLNWNKQVAKSVPRTTPIEQGPEEAADFIMIMYWNKWCARVLKAIQLRTFGAIGILFGFLMFQAISWPI